MRKSRKSLLQSSLDNSNFMSDKNNNLLFLIPFSYFLWGGGGACTSAHTHEPPLELWDKLVGKEISLNDTNTGSGNMKMLIYL